MSNLTQFFAQDAVDVARHLIGWHLQVGDSGGVIVETEAYRDTDEASHAFRGQTPRNAAMFGPPAHIYVYRSYGIHWCVNFVCTTGSAVLIRAVEPDNGLALMSERRGTNDPRNLCSGPGKLCQALGIDLSFNGLPLDRPPLHLTAANPAVAVVSGRRIGISRNVEPLWRFGLKGSAFLSRRFPD